MKAVTHFLRTHGHRYRLVVVPVDEYRTSQTCPCCFGAGNLAQHEAAGVPVYALKHCTKCGAVVHRDTAAAMCITVKLLFGLFWPLLGQTERGKVRQAFEEHAC